MNVAVRTENILTPSQKAADAYDVSLGYLRAFVTVLVVLHHSLVGYMGLPVSKTFTPGAMMWRLSPVTDPTHPWSLASLIVGFNDTYFMALMFLLSGLFVQQSIARKGAWGFVRDRVLRLGIPFLFCAAVVTQIAYYFAYLQSGGTGGIAGYIAAWPSIGYWPTGPAWFISLLLAFDIVAAAFFAVMPRWGQWIGKLNANAAEKPGRFFLIFALLSLAAYAPLAHLYGSQAWTYWNFFQFQSSRPLNYFLYFAMGIGMGAYGIRRGLLSPEGKLARRWWLWMLILTPVIFIVGLALFVAILGTKGTAQQALVDIGSVVFVLNCAIVSFAWLAVFTRFVKRANPVMDSLTRNAYGIYIVHYAFVAAVQYALLPATLPGAAKAILATAGALALSWVTSAMLRRIPLASRLVGE
jgi:peptidoglycan/LPS O-acetylase OafA/YrhL